MRIKAFKALRPLPDDVHLVASPPYDTVSEDEVREIVNGNPWSFLRVLRPEADLPEGTDPHSDEAYAMSARTFAGMIEAGKLVREETDCLYVYRQTMGKHAQSGVVACCHADDYMLNVIRRHERTRADKEEDRVRHVESLSAHSGPAFLAYRRHDAVDQIVAVAESQEPLFDLTAPDGVQHTVWRVEAPAALVEAFASVPTAYIADGHHRCAAAGRVAQKRRDGADGEQESDWFLTVLFPAEDLQILPYNRVVSDLNGLTEADFLVRVREQFTVTEMVDPQPAGPHRVSMYLSGRWFGLSWKTTAETDAVAELDVSYLQENLLAPVLGIDDPRQSKRIDFVGGIRGTEELERRVDTGGMAVAFSMYPVAVEQMMAISDADAIMPPKSTWFEPKLRSGLFVHSF